MGRTRVRKQISWIVALALMVEALAFAWMRPAAAALDQTGTLDGWVICHAHDDANDGAPASDPQHAPAHHDLSCILCAAGCIPPLAMPVGPVAIRAPSERGPAAPFLATASRPRAPPFTLRNARAPPALS